MTSGKNKQILTPKNYSIDSSELPSVTIGIPAYNEENHIKQVIRNFQKNTYPNIVEILVSDGGSTDKTREIVENISRDDDRVKLLFNKNKIQSTALNQMISIASGEIFIRADAHCEYEKNYVERSVRVLLATKAHNVGGAQRFVAKNAVQAGIAIAVHSFLGSGGAKYRDPTYSGFADTVFLGCYYTEELRSISGFREENRTNQDADLNLRLWERYNNAVYVDSQIRSWYYPRQSFSDLWKQYFWYGWGRHVTLKNHPGYSPLRGRIPFLVISAFLVYTLIDLLVPNEILYSEWIIITALCIYLLESIRLNIRLNPIFVSTIWRGDTSKHPGFFKRTITVFFVFITMQIAHFSGYVYQFFKREKS